MRVQRVELSRDDPHTHMISALLRVIAHSTTKPKHATPTVFTVPWITRGAVRTITPLKYGTVFTVLYVFSLALVFSPNDLTPHRTASLTCSSASGILHAITTPRGRLLPGKPCPCGNIAGAHSRWTSHPATSSSNYYGRRLETCQNVRVRARSPVRGSGSRRACKSHSEASLRKVELGSSEIRRKKL